MSVRRNNRIDLLLGNADRVLRTLWGVPKGTGRANPAGRIRDDGHPALDDASRRRAGRLMRVNLAGEVAAQALYHGQSITARDPRIARKLQRAADEENDHLLWCRQRLAALGTRPSILNPFWYAGAFAIGTLAGVIGDAESLGFLDETERQVVEHLEGHLARLPGSDEASRRVLKQMRADEARHSMNARAAGGRRPPPLSRLAMKLAARVMTTTAYRL